MDSDPNLHDHYDVVVSAYMRGGSSLLGQILGYHNDSFFVYEPFWLMAPWIYWKGNNSVCRTDRSECRNSSSYKHPDAMFMTNTSLRSTISLNQAQKIMSQIYGCRLKSFESLVLHPFIAENSGAPWKPIILCYKKHGNAMVKNASCINQDIIKACKNAKHRVTKVVRFSLDRFESLLQTKENLKVIHLFRDPRAIMNSRFHAEWYPRGDFVSTTKSLCRKMMHDYQVGQKLMKKYPYRFRFLYYEDLNDKPSDKIKTIYRYLGMSVKEHKFPIVKNTNVFTNNGGNVSTDREKNTAYWWRKQLRWHLVKQIDNICKDVYNALGYVAFSTYDEMANLTFKSIHIPTEYVIM